MAGGGEAEEIQEDASNVADWHKLPPELWCASCIISIDLCQNFISGVSLALIIPGITHEFGDGGKRWGLPDVSFTPV